MAAETRNRLFRWQGAGLALLAGLAGAGVVLDRWVDRELQRAEATRLAIVEAAQNAAPSTPEGRDDAARDGATTTPEPVLGHGVSANHLARPSLAALDGDIARFRRLSDVAGLASLSTFLVIVALILRRVQRPLHSIVEAEVAALEQERDAMAHSALHDALTGLPNRRYLDEYLEKTLASAGRNAQTVAVLHLDLDRFKAVNDTLGHAAGDAVLRAVTHTLLATIRTADFAARIGGDEFVIVAPSVNSIEGLRTLSDRLISRLQTPIPFEEHLCEIGTSIGIALAQPGSGLDPEALIARADQALYDAKNSGRGVHRFYPGDDGAQSPGEASAA